jgi:hypothetical protein
VWLQLDTPALGIQLKPLKVAAPELAVKVAEAELHGDVTYEQQSDGGVSAHGTVAAQTPSLRKLVTDLGLNKTLPHDPTTLGQLELTTGWSYANGALAAKPIALKLDGVTLQGWMERGAAPVSGWKFELHGDRINLDKYVQLDSTSQKPFELQSLKTINANGSLVFDEAQWANTRLSDVRLRFE